MRELKLFGIEIRPHWTFLMFLFLILFTGGTKSLLIILLIFSSIVFHEISHSLVAKYYGVDVKKIILLPIGGMAMIEKSLKEPKHEFLTSIAGPSFNFVIFFICSYILTTIDETSFLFETISILRDANLILGSFNLFIPAIPMDGGRILRSLLAMKLGFVKATQIATKVSKFIALFAFFLAFTLLVAGEFSSAVWISILALFVFFGANTEYEGMVVTETLSQFNVSDALIPYLPIISPDDSIDTAFRFMFENKLPSVLISGKKLSMIDHSDFEKINKKEWNTKKVSSISRPCKGVNINTSIIDALKIMEESKCSMLPVFHNKSIIGVITKENIVFMFSMMKQQGVQ